MEVSTLSLLKSDSVEVRKELKCFPALSMHERDCLPKKMAAVAEGYS